MKSCKMCGKDLIGKERILCRHCKEAGKDGAKRGGRIVAALSVAAAAVVKVSPKVAPLVRRSIDVLRRFK